MSSHRDRFYKAFAAPFWWSLEALGATNTHPNIVRTRMVASSFASIDRSSFAFFDVLARARSISAAEADSADCVFFDILARTCDVPHRTRFCAEGVSTLCARAGATGAASAA